LGIDAVQIRDTAEVPFIGFAGGDLLVQGNQQVDIVALSHADSGLYSYGDMVLRSANPVGGDAHYWSGGNFRLETLDGSTGDLFSPIDPIIRTLNDVVIDEYEGSSLHILAGGEVNIRTARVTAADAGQVDIDFLQETITLSDGTLLQIDGGTQPTLDIRAGVIPEALGIPPLDLLTGFNNNTQDIFQGNSSITDQPSSANIVVGDVFMFVPNGLVVFTNQYQPNESLVTGDIFLVGSFGITSIATLPSELIPDIVGRGVSFTADSRNDFRIVSRIDSSSSVGDSGQINVLAGRDVILNNARLTANVQNEGNSGDIQINAGSGVILENGSGILTAVDANGDGDSKNILIIADDSVILRDESFIGSVVGNGAIGDSGSISIQTSSLFLEPNSQITTVLGENTSGSVGEILINATDSIRLSGEVFADPSTGQSTFTRISSINLGDGDGGDIQIVTDDLELIGDSQITSGVFGAGNSGDVYISAGSISMLGFPIQSLDQLSFTAIGSRVEQGGVGSSGDLFINTNSLEMSNAQIAASVLGDGQAGDILVDATNSISLLNGSSIISNVLSEVEGKGGNIFLQSGDISLRNGSAINAIIRRSMNGLPAGRGVAGNIFVNADRSLSLGGINAFTDVASNISTSIDRGARGEGGSINISAPRVEIIDNAIVASTLDFEAIGTSGVINIDVKELAISNGGRLSTTTFSEGNAGQVTVDASDSIVIIGSSDVLATGIASRTEGQATGNGGEIIVNAENLFMTDNAQITAETDGLGDAGRIFVEGFAQILLTNRSFISTSTSVNSSGEGGFIQISTKKLDLFDESNISSNSQGSGSAGNIDLTIFDQTNLFNSALTTSSPNAFGGNIAVNQDQNFNSIILLQENGDIRTNSFGDGGNITLNGTVIAFGDSDIIARSETGRGGNIILGPFFSETLPPDTEQPFDADGRVDLNADGFIAAGQIITPDVSFVESSLTNLEDTIIDTSTLTAGSCIARTADDQGSFVVTGRDGIPPRPGDMGIAAYPTGTVQTIESGGASLPQMHPTGTLQEPDGVYQLPDGRLVLSRECD
jgi:large exoprotein involved in heme utilization and adhesion